LDIMSILLFVVAIVFPFMALYKAQDAEAKVKTLEKRIIKLEEKLEEK